VFKTLKDKGWEVASINHGELIARIEFKDEFEKIVHALSNWNIEIENNIIKRGGGQADQTLELTRIFHGNEWFKNRIKVENVVSFESKFEPMSSNSTTHEIDHIILNDLHKMIALEIEWNNKDEFFDRDFQSMRGLFELGVIDLAVIVTRGEKLEQSFKPMVAKYFRDNGIGGFEDFAKLEDHFREKNGETRFSFPTSPQRREIQKKLDRGVEFDQACAEVFVANKFGGTTTNWRQLRYRIERNNAGRTPMIFFGIPPLATSQ